MSRRTVQHGNKQAAPYANLRTLSMARLSMTALAFNHKLYAALFVRIPLLLERPERNCRGRALRFLFTHARAFPQHSVVVTDMDGEDLGMTRTSLIRHTIKGGRLPETLTQIL